jgi:hypothetical protein
VVRTIGKFISKPWSDKDRAHFGRIIRMASQTLHQDSSRSLMNMVISTVSTEVDPAGFAIRTRPIPHLAGAAGSTVASKLIVSMLKAKIPKSVSWFKSNQSSSGGPGGSRAGSARKPSRPSPKTPQKQLSPRHLGGAHRSKLPAPPSPSAPSPVAASRQLNNLSKARSLGRGTGRGVPRKPLPQLMRPQQARADGGAGAGPVRRSPKTPMKDLNTSVSETDEEEEPSRSSDSGEEEDDDDESEEVYKIGETVSSVKLFLGMEAILNSSRLRPFFEEWMPVDKQSAEVAFVYMAQKFVHEANSRQAAKLARKIVDEFLSKKDMSIPNELVSQIKKTLSENADAPPNNLFVQAVNNVLITLDRNTLPLFRGSDEYLDLLVYLSQQENDDGLGNNPFLDHDDLEDEGGDDDDEDDENGEGGDGQGENPYVGTDIDELADLAANLDLGNEILLYEFE